MTVRWSGKEVPKVQTGTGVTTWNREKVQTNLAMDTWFSDIQGDIVTTHQVMQLLRVSRSRDLPCKRIAHGEQKRNLADCFIRIMKTITLFRNPNCSSVGKTATHFRSEEWLQIQVLSLNYWSVPALFLQLPVNILWSWEEMTGYAKVLPKPLSRELHFLLSWMQQFTKKVLGHQFLSLCPATLDSESDKI